jgi:hypothetical protein
MLEGDAFRVVLFEPSAGFVVCVEDFQNVTFLVNPNRFP